MGEVCEGESGHDISDPDDATAACGAELQDAGDQVHHAGAGPDQVREGALGQRAGDHRRVHHAGAVPDPVPHAWNCTAESSAKDSAEKLYWDCGDLGYVNTNGEALIAYRYEL